jgi:Fatty acid/phospholipid biosynthesis enzyme
MIKLLIDCFGGDHSPQAPVEGALAALAKNPDLHLILTRGRGRPPEGTGGQGL